jgi:catechol 2,3-dioxygenase-like lactoylglutathione lyase family enzyme
MSIAKAWDVSYVKFRAPDLNLMRNFLSDFGLVEAEVSEDSIFMRSYGSAPFVHVTELGEAGFAGFGIKVTEAELEKLAAHDGVPITPLDAPGGGRIARLLDPDGFVVEAVAGQASVEPIDLPATYTWNESGIYSRQSRPRRVTAHPSHVIRLGHVVLVVTDFRKSEAWYKERFGFLTSDEIHPEARAGFGGGAFMRCDRGDVPADHHSVFVLEGPGAPTFFHSAFEVAGVDDLMAGHDHLAAAGHTLQWGVGRHVLGSQIFDYWRDPYGHEIEHWTDGDQFVAADPADLVPFETLTGVQWGSPLPPHPLSQ